MNRETKSIWIIILVLFLMQIAAATTEYWDTPEECNINTVKSYSDIDIIASCNVEVQSNGDLTFDNVTFKMNTTGGYNTLQRLENIHLRLRQLY